MQDKGKRIVIDDSKVLARTTRRAELRSTNFEKAEGTGWRVREIINFLLSMLVKIFIRYGQRDIGYVSIGSRAEI